MLRSLAALALMLLTWSALAAPTLVLSNAGPEALSPVVEVPEPPEGVTAVAVPGGGDSPIQRTADGRALVMAPGLLHQGDTLRLGGVDRAVSPTDLTVEAADDSITVRNAFLSVTFPKKGHGGLPTAVGYPVSGHVERSVEWYDRVYEKGRGQIYLRDDPEGTAEVVEEGPLQVVVETRGRYTQGEDTLGNLRAVYRWTFTASSPIVGFSAHVEREDDFAWSELHVLQVSRKDDRLRNWAGESAQIISGPLKDDNTSQVFNKWGALDDGENGIGLAWDSFGVIMYDGRTSYVTYLQQSVGFAGRAHDTAGRLYIGPALAPERYSEEFSRKPAVTARWEQPQADAAARPEGDTVKISDGKLEIGFLAETYGCAMLRDLQTGHDFIRSAEHDALTWAVQLRDGKGEISEVLSTTAAKRTHTIREDGRQITLRWNDIAVGSNETGVHVEVTVSLTAPGRAEWRIDVDNRTEDWSVASVSFPKLTNFSSPRHPSVAVPRSNWGLLYRNCTAVSGSYPSADWPCEFVSMHEDETGLYLGYEDPGCWPKWFHCSPGNEFQYRVQAENDSVMGNDFRSPGPVVTQLCGPSWWSAAKLYRSWALKQAWTREGHLTTRASTPDFCKDLGLWFCGGGTGDEVIANMRKAREFFGVPVGLHWYSWHEWPFDTHYPDYFPAQPHLKQATDALVPEGHVLMPYINGRIVDKDVEAYAQYMPWVAMPLGQESYTEVYGNGVRQSPMCPATAFWQNTIATICDTLIGEYGVNGIYIDQIGAAGPALCYDPDHGHPLGGGSHWVDGYRKMLEEVQRHAHRDGRNVLITTENNAEPYMDGVDCFLIWNPRHPDEIPLMTAVYSGYSLYFASNARCEAGLQPYAMIEGRDFIWGSQMGWMGFEGPGPRGDYLRQLVRLRHAALKYVVFGEIMGELLPSNDVGKVTGKWHDWAGKPYDSTLPAVMSTVWKGSDGTLGVFMANLSGEQKQFACKLDQEQFGGLPGEGGNLALTYLSKEGSRPFGYVKGLTLDRTFTLDPWQARVVEVRRVDSPGDVQVEDAVANTDEVQQFDLEAWAVEQGIEWQVDLPQMVIAEGDVAKVNASVRGGDLQQEAWVEWADWRLYSTLHDDEGRPGWRRMDALPVRAPMEAKAGGTLDAAFCIDLDAAHQTGEPRVVRVPLKLKVVAPLSVALDDAAFRAGESSGVTVLLTNNQSVAEPAGTRVLLTAPGDWDLWPGRAMTFGPIPAGATVRRVIRCALPADTAAGSAWLKAAIVQESVGVQAPISPARPRVSAHRLTPAVDADLTEWQALTAISLGAAHAANVKDYKGAEDLSAKAWVGADADNLYLAAEVTDDVHRQENVHEMLWNGDALQVDFRPGMPPRASSFDQVLELGLALGPDGPELWQWEPARRVVPGGKVAILRDGARTLYEAAVPWAALPGLRHESGAVAGFSMTVNEMDEGEFRGWLELTPGICGGKDASHFGIMEF